MGRGEAERAVEQQHREEMLGAQVRDIPVIHQVDAVVGQAHGQVGDVVSAEACTCASSVSSASSAAWIGAPAAHFLIDACMISNRLPRPSTRASGRGVCANASRKVRAPGERVLDPGEAGPDHGRRGDAVARRHAAEIERLLDVLRIAHPVREAGCLLHGVGQLEPYLARVQAEQRAGRGRRPEQAAEAVGAVRPRIGAPSPSAMTKRAPMS